MGRGWSARQACRGRVRKKGEGAKPGRQAAVSAFKTPFFSD